MAHTSDDEPLQLRCSVRTRQLADTLRLAQRQMAGLGISRVSDITRMDRLGLPVFASVRPRGRTLRVHAGKGVDALAARVGALLEAIEYAVAEPQRTTWDVETLSVRDLTNRWRGRFGWMDLAPALGVAVTPRTRLDVIACEDLVGGRSTPLPAELVFVPWQPRRNKRPIFGVSTNGLASGNSPDEATLHALLEVMERDAVSMNLPRDVSEWVDPTGLPAPFADMAAAWRDIGVDLAVRRVPNAFSLPCFQACLLQRDEARVNMAAGHGLHLCRDIALARAVCEAAQSRLSHIHGGRDDIIDYYDRTAAASVQQRQHAMALETAAWFDASRSVDYQAVASCMPQTLSIRAMLDVLIERLAQQGLHDVFRYRFPLDLQGLHVVRVVVPGLEHVHGGGRRLGPRMLRQVLGHAGR